MFKKSFKLIIKIIFSISILWFLLQKLDFANSLKLISEINLYIFITTLGLYIFGQYISSIKWGFISKKLGFNFAIKDYVNYYFTGMFFNLFLPTSVGGDVIKGYYLCKQDIPNNKNKALISVFWDRLTGAMTLVILSFLGLLFTYTKMPAFIDISILLAFIGVIVVVCALPLISKIKVKESINIFIQNILKLNQDKGLWKQVLLYAFAFHFLVVLIHYMLAISLGLNIPVVYLLIVYPIAAIASFLPISLNGIGVREGVYVYFLTLIGISYEQAFAYSVLWFLVMTIASLFSVIFYLKSKNEIKN